MNNVTYTTPDTSVEIEKTESWKSNDITELATALAKAQSEIDGARKNTTNDWFKSNYADLHQVIQSSFPQLTKYGLSVIQGSDWINGNIHVTTMLCHSSGQWVKSSVCMPLKDNYNAQDVGTAVTYGRRYGLSAMVGVAQYDDDAQSISPPKPKAKPKTKKAKPLTTTDIHNGTNDIVDII